MDDFKDLSGVTLNKIRSFGIKSKSVIKSFKRSCRLLEAFLEENNLSFSQENAEQWLSESAILKKSNRSQRNLYLSHRRAILLLLEMSNNQLDEWKVYPIKTAQRPATEHYLGLLEQYKHYLISEKMSESTITFSLRVVSMFFCYLESANIVHISDLIPKNVSDFWGNDALSGRKPTGLQAYAYKLKKFFIFLEEKGILSQENLYLSIPKIFAKQVKIVTTISKNAEKELISNGKLITPLGKRDQAIILLALRLGVRRSDIVGLKFTDINWKNETITFTQQKTKVPVILPLLTDVGNALMDYILNSRVNTDSEEIFLRGYAPYKALKPSSASKVPIKYLSDFSSDDCPEKGLHILRRTVASRLFENNISSSIISASLGHLNPDSADVYISTDSQKMRKCALSLSGIECTREELV
ncbi:tyrosine-type recombinase/integrase [Ureibacillus sp. MALMAid1270]|uniref:tyrosine-type recombinase/integrase n=1 Tax=Ureibacillus sp. MALMAid1270 TaxID=3411629 RepID=UPI003BA551CC